MSFAQITSFITFVFFFGPYAQGSSCNAEILLIGEIPAYIDEQGITVGGIPALMYPIETIRANLNLTDQRVATLKARRVLLIGDGYSPLLPHLRANGVDALAIDPIYDAEKHLSEPHDLLTYIRTQRPYLIGASASAYLKKVPSQSIASIYSHMAISSILDSNVRNEIFSETARVLECDGSARFAWYGFKESEAGYQVLLTRAFSKDSNIHFTLSDNGKTQHIHSLDASLELIGRQRAYPQEWVLPTDRRVQYLDIWRECL